MDNINEYLFLLDNAVIWAIMITAFLCYGLLIDLCFIKKNNANWFDSTTYWSTSINTMLGALPLLGLLGTISGLLKTFVRMSHDNGFALQEVISGGIAEAMFTTQLGLIMVVPGLLMLTYLHRKRNTWIIRAAHEINN